MLTPGPLPHGLSSISFLLGLPPPWGGGGGEKCTLNKNAFFFYSSGIAQLATGTQSYHQERVHPPPPHLPYRKNIPLKQRECTRRRGDRDQGEGKNVRKKQPTIIICRCECISMEAGKGGYMGVDIFLSRG
jgi:hypothetical protein